MSLGAGNKNEKNAESMCSSTCTQQELLYNNCMISSENKEDLSTLKSSNFSMKSFRIEICFASRIRSKSLTSKIIEILF
jgi:hypothetical protein